MYIFQATEDALEIRKEDTHQSWAPLIKNLALLIIHPLLKTLTRLNIKAILYGQFNGS